MLNTELRPISNSRIWGPPCFILSVEIKTQAEYKVQCCRHGTHKPNIYVRSQKCKCVHLVARCFYLVYLKTTAFLFSSAADKHSSQLRLILLAPSSPSCQSILYFNLIEVLFHFKFKKLSGISKMISINIRRIHCYLYASSCGLSVQITQPQAQFSLRGE